MPGKPDRLVVDPFHQAAIPGDYPGAVINQPAAEHGIEVAFGQRHAHCHRKPLPQRAGGAFHRRYQEILGVPGADAVDLAEFADVLDRRRFVSGQV